MDHKFAFSITCLSVALLIILVRELIAPYIGGEFTCECGAAIIYRAGQKKAACNRCGKVTEL